MYHVIMAGGIGSRFWPLSNKDKPKQFLKIINDISLIKATYDRILNCSKYDNIFVVSSKNYVQQIKENLPEIKEDNIIIEPSPKNTAPAIYLAAKKIYEIDKSASLAVYPSDHYIKDDIKFKETVFKVSDFLDHNLNAIVTIGIKPTFPSTEYGYIKPKIIGHAFDISEVDSFIEKPDLDRAENIVKTNSCLWNSGMFFFKAENIIHEIEKYNIDINDKNLHSDWDSLPSISIDYAVLEKTKNCFCIVGDFDWSDLGTWESLYKLLDKDKNRNVIKGEYKGIDSKNNLVYSPGKLTAIVGLNNIAVINVQNTTLVFDISKNDKLKKLVKKINKK